MTINRTASDSRVSAQTHIVCGTRAPLELRHREAKADEQASLDSGDNAYDALTRLHALGYDMSSAFITRRR